MQICSILLFFFFFLTGNRPREINILWLSEGQLGRARIKMRQELIINCDPREDPGDQVLTNTYWNAQLGMCVTVSSVLWK